MEDTSGTEGEHVSYSLNGFPAAAVRFVRALERNRELIALDHGVSASELAALFHIGEVASTTPKELARHMRMTTGAITAISGSLVAANLIYRLDHPSDRRSLYLQLTPGGHALMAQIHSEFQTMIGDSTAGLSAKQIADFEASLRSVTKQIEERIAR